MTPDQARSLLTSVREGRLTIEKALQAFSAPPVEDLPFAAVDLHRTLRKGFPEVIFGAGKTPEQTVSIARRILSQDGQLLVTRITPAHATRLRRTFRKAVHHELARCVTVESPALPKRPGRIAVVAAGTSDLPVAEEAAITASIMGNEVVRLYDVGVAGIHRLFQRLEDIRSARVVIVVAGMEGALPSVVGGLIRRPLIAVPTSIGYGANFGGLSALLTSLTSCASGLTVVNIDNGFGAGYAASQINALAQDAAAGHA
ncbi:MAG: nickel pincer cofactor biosynthesis protein LarB [Verrucomicrobiales bacterium]|nr:nickel pincer cofactor biosynthesis protein LarB [Verrucomicrobiales bacterium]